MDNNHDGIAGNACCEVHYRRADKLQSELAAMTRERDELLKQSGNYDTLEKLEIDKLHAELERVERERDEYRMALELAWFNEDGIPTSAGTKHYLAQAKAQLDAERDKEAKASDDR